MNSIILCAFGWVFLGADICFKSRINRGYSLILNLIAIILFGISLVINFMGV